MGLSVTVSRPVDREWFTSAEPVRGTVVWDGELTISKITIYLEGRNIISTRPLRARHGHNFGGVQHVLFVREKVVYLASEHVLEKHKNARRTGKHAFQFELEFPDVGEVASDGSSCTRCQKVLPPSFDFDSEPFNASVNYRIRVVAQRPGILTGNTTTTANVNFRPLLPTRPLLTDQPWKIRNHLDAVALGFPKQDTASNRSIVFELAFPASKVVRPGHRIDLGMNFVVPVELQRLWKQIWIFHIVVKLNTTTHVRVSGSRKSHIGSTEVCNVKGLYPLSLPAEYPRVIVPPELWQHHVYPTILPSLRLCQLQRSHTLEVLVKFACLSTNRTHSVEAQIEVTVESGAMLPSEAPPAYA